MQLFCQPLTCKTKSGLEIAGWFYRHMVTLKSMGQAHGSLFPNKSGEGMSIAEMDMLLHDLLCEVQRVNALMIPDGVEVRKEYSVSRSLRRGSTSEAQNAGMSEEVIRAHNRWRKFARSHGLCPGMSMIEHYLDAKVLTPTLLKYLYLMPS